MPYIPEAHKKYDLLPWKRENGGEVFSYPCSLLDRVNSLLAADEKLDPYGYKSYEEYYSRVDLLAKKYADTEEYRMLFQRFREKMQEMNVKEDWSVLRYLGPSDDRITGIKQGHTYYWPCSRSCPVYEGVIDEEEYTSYYYPTEPQDWEILEDPTGMAYETLYNKAKGYSSRESYDRIMAQVKELASREQTECRD